MGPGLKASLLVGAVVAYFVILFLTLAYATSYVVVLAVLFMAPAVLLLTLLWQAAYWEFKR